MQAPAGAHLDQGEQQVLGGDVLVLEALGFAEGLIQNPGECAADPALVGPAVDLWDAAEQLVHPVSEGARHRAQALHHPEHHAVGLRQQCVEQVLGLDDLVVAVGGETLGAGERLLGAPGQLVEIHLYPSPFRTWPRGLPWDPPWGQADEP